MLALFGISRRYVTHGKRDYLTSNYHNELLTSLYELTHTHTHTLTHTHSQKGEKKKSRWWHSALNSMLF